MPSDYLGLKPGLRALCLPASCHGDGDAPFANEAAGGWVADYLPSRFTSSKVQTSLEQVKRVGVGFVFHTQEIRRENFPHLLPHWSFFNFQTKHEYPSSVQMPIC